jgi:NAD(P)-dependent dehydrogenase (short-subunit alcohol dehydrogenase family)
MININNLESLNLENKTIVFTGATDGMGREAVKKLAKMQANIMLLARNAVKAIELIEELKRMSNNKNIFYVPCDLSSQKSVRTAAEIVLKKCSKIDILINCAGANLNERRINDDGYEVTWAVNHLAPFLLNNLLLDKLKKSSAARIVNLSSATQKYGHIHLEDIQLANSGWTTLKSYAQAKLAMNMCTRKMARELEGTGVTVNALNPGFIKTNLCRDLTGWKNIVGKVYSFFSAELPEKGANRILNLALSEGFEGVSGMFVYEEQIRKPNPEALDDNLVDKVWDISMNHVGLANK